MIEISPILSKLIKKHGLETPLLESKLRLNWPYIVGEEIAAHTAPVRIQFGKLYVWVDSLDWRHQLASLRPTLLQKVNACIGNPMVKDVVLKTGQPPRPERHFPKPTPTEAPAPKIINPELALCIEAYLGSVEDPGLKETVRRVMMKSFASGSSGDHPR